MNEHLIAVVMCTLFLVIGVIYLKNEAKKKKDKDNNRPEPTVTTPNEVDKEIAKQLEEIRKKIKF